ncbi:MAG: hypothetical protein AVO33_06280 [delta proteobacterium ML8_F1]|nr:MAG: hypothetical protein AVO33_06280 [delta proteobacterium ML8_F1]
MQFSTITEELQVTEFRKGIERELEAFFEAKGYRLIQPRIFQGYDSFVCSNLRQDSSKTVKVLGGDSRIFILRPDITTNILHQIFSKWEGSPPLKVYYNSKIYRNQPAGGILEHYQMGVESLGEDSLKGDQEMIEMAAALMGTLGEPFIIELGSSKYLDGFFKELDLDLETEGVLRDLISKKNRDGLRRRVRALGLEDTVLSTILEMEGNMESVLDRAKSYERNDEMMAALDELEGLREFFSTRALLRNIHFDLSMMPDLDYYDGIIFKGYALNTPKKILSGGRYDRLTQRFGKTVSAIGFMLDMDLVTRIRIKGEA